MTTMTSTFTIAKRRHRQIKNRSRLSSKKRTRTTWRSTGIPLGSSSAKSHSSTITDARPVLPQHQHRPTAGKIPLSVLVQEAEVSALSTFAPSAEDLQNLLHNPIEFVPATYLTFEDEANMAPLEFCGKAIQRQPEQRKCRHRVRLISFP